MLLYLHYDGKDNENQVLAFKIFLVQKHSLKIIFDQIFATERVKYELLLINQDKILYTLIIRIKLDKK